MTAKPLLQFSYAGAVTTVLVVGKSQLLTVSQFAPPGRFALWLDSPEHFFQ